MTGPEPRPRVGVLCPMPSELRPLTRALALRREPMGDGWFLHSGVIGEVEVAATTTGIGMRAGAAAANRLLGSVRVDHLLVVGIAGGVAPNVEIGEVVVPEVVIDEATGAEYRPARFGAGARLGTLATSDDLLVDAEAQARLLARGVVAVDMETAAIASVCEERGCPWSAFRGISDRARDGLIDHELLALAGPDGKGDLAAVARYLFRRPWRIRRLARLGRDSSLAARRVAEAAIAACGEHGRRPD